MLMPRPPTFQSVVRNLRERFKLSQPALASRLGVSAMTIRKIENGSLAISRKFALRLSWATGTKFEDIMANKLDAVSRLAGVTVEDLRMHDEHARNTTDEELDVFVRNVAYQAEQTFRAVRDYAPRKFYAIDAAIRTAIDAVNEEFEVESFIEKVKAEMAEEFAKNPTDWKRVPIKMKATAKAWAAVKRSAQSAKKPAPRLV
jgi:transcriptional regulator with XRE-family HTH domain